MEGAWTTEHFRGPSIETGRTVLKCMLRLFTCTERRYFSCVLSSAWVIFTIVKLLSGIGLNWLTKDLTKVNLFSQPKKTTEIPALRCIQSILWNYCSKYFLCCPWLYFPFLGDPIESGSSRICELLTKNPSGKILYFSSTYFELGKIIVDSFYLKYWGVYIDTHNFAVGVSAL